MILSQKQIEEIAAAVTEDFNKFFFGTESEKVRMARATPIDQFARDYLGLQVSFARLSSDGSICGLTAYTDTEYIVEEKGVRRTLPLKSNQVLLDESFIRQGQMLIKEYLKKHPEITVVKEYCDDGFTGANFVEVR